MTTEEGAWKRDETPYIVFPCSKCGQYSYVKTTQKGKKCLRCRRSHVVSKIKGGELVNGMTAAVMKVKERQEEFSMKELGRAPMLKANDDFCVAGKVQELPEFTFNGVKDREGNADYSGNFKALLVKLGKTHESFPSYAMRLMASDFGIPHHEIKKLKNLFVKKGFLISLRDGYFKLKN